jgi:transcriptional regulator with XRE-family HTH domain
MTLPELIRHLKAIRVRKNVSAAVVGNLAGRSGSVIRELENQVVTRPRVDTLQAWAKSLGYELTFDLKKIE